MRAACCRQQPMQHHPRKRNATAKAAEGLAVFAFRRKNYGCAGSGPSFFAIVASNHTGRGSFVFVIEPGLFWCRLLVASGRFEGPGN